MAKILIVGGFTLMGLAVGQPALGFSVGMTVANLLVPPDPQKYYGPKTDAYRLQTSTFGVPIHRVWGTLRVGGNVIWASEVEEREISTEQNNVITISYQYYQSFAVGICLGPIQTVRRIWADATLIWDASDTNQGIVSMEGLDFDLYLGTTTQDPNPVMEGIESARAELPVGTTYTVMPAYRGLAYVYFQDFPLYKFGNRMPQFSFEVVNNDTPSTPYVGIFDAYSATNGYGNVNLHPDGFFVYTESGNNWYKIDPVTTNVVLHVDHSDTTSNYLPTNSSIGFAFDEEGYIYTTRDTDVNDAELVKLDPDTLQVVQASGLIESGWDFIQIKVSRNPTYPLVFLLRTNRRDLVIMRRDTFTAPPKTAGYWLAQLSIGESWTHMAFDNDTGALWLFMYDTTASATINKIYKVVVDLNATDVTMSSWDVGAYIEAGVNTYITFDPVGSQIIIGADADNRIVFFDPDGLDNSDDGFLGEITSADASAAGVSAGDLVGTYGWSYWNQGPVNGVLYYNGGLTSDQIIRINVGTRTIEAVDTLTDDSGDNSLFNGSGIYHPRLHALISNQTNIDSSWEMAKVLLNRSAESGVALSSIVSDVCNDAGLTAAQIDVTALTDTVRGFVVTAREPARATLEQLALAYFFDAVERDGQVVFVKRGGASAVTIPEADLAAHREGDQRPQELISVRRQEIELPKHVDVTFISQTASYDVAMQRASRTTRDAQDAAVISFDLSLNDDEAATIAMRHLSQAWVERVSHTFIVGREYSYLEPCDVVTVSEGGNTHVVRIVRMQYSGGLITIDGVNVQASLYSQTVDGAPITPTRDDEIVTYPGPTALVIADVPPVRSIDDSASVYAFMAGILDGWRGAQLYKSVDGGASWADVLTSTSDALVGKAVTVLADVPDPFVWDEGNTVRVALSDPDDILTAATEAQVLNGANLCVLGDELIQFKNCSLDVKGTWTLSGLTRGRYGTDYATGSHAIGEGFAMFTTPALYRLAPIGVEYQNTQHKFKAVSIGDTSDGAPPVTKTVALNMLKPLSVTQIRGYRTNGDLHISWKRRTRFNGEWLDGVDVPLGETTEQYQVEIYNGSTRVRTFLPTLQGQVYAGAHHIIDGIAFGDPVGVIVYQVSSVVGLGQASPLTVL